jgi:hypothetical protein
MSFNASVDLAESSNVVTTSTAITATPAQKPIPKNSTSTKIQNNLACC